MGFNVNLQHVFSTKFNGVEGWKPENDFDHFWKWFANETTTEAYDEKDNTFEKSVALGISHWKFSDDDNNPMALKEIISFGWPCQYNIDDLVKLYPFTEPLCIDAAGRNHRMSPVYISAFNMNRVVEHFMLTPEERVRLTVRALATS